MRRDSGLCALCAVRCAMQSREEKSDALQLREEKSDALQLYEEKSDAL